MAGSFRLYEFQPSGSSSQSSSIPSLSEDARWSASGRSILWMVKDLRYVVDTSGGSSGSGVLDAQGLLVRVRRASGCTATSGANTATSMQYVFDNVPEVRSQIVAAWQGVLG